MNSTYILKLARENHTRFQNFIIFEPNASRVLGTDIFLKGHDVKILFDKLYTKLDTTKSLKHLILFNRLSKIKQMLDLVQNQEEIIISKFFDRVWKRYSYISNLGELFLDIGTFLHHFPEYLPSLESLMAQRLDEEGEELDLAEEPAEDSDEKISTPMEE